jgi:putative transposase
MWSPKGQQVMIPTPGQPKKHYGLGAVNYHTGETVLIIRKRKRRQEIAQLLQALVDKHPTGTIYVAWDNVSTHQDQEIEAVVRAAAGRLVLLYLPTYSPWLNPIEMLWRHFRREVTHCELFETVQALLEATRDFFDRYNQMPHKILSIIGSPLRASQDWLNCPYGRILEWCGRASKGRATPIFFGARPRWDSLVLLPALRPAVKDCCPPKRCA